MGKNETAGPSVALLTMAVVAAMIAEAVKNLVTPDQAKELIAESQKDLATKQEVAELLTKSETNLVEYINSTPPITAELSSRAALDDDLPEPVNSAWLAGLTFLGATQEKRTVNGRPTMIATPFERDLEPEDILAFRVTDEQVILVAADGQKHTVNLYGSE